MFLQQFSDYIADWNAGAIAIRLIAALFTGIAVGVERGLKRRGAGIKTHTLVCLGAALVMLTGQYIYKNFPGNMDMSRLGAQVISGVGFLGVGTIIVTGHNQIRGLTTAAGLWVCACLGLAIGIGFVEGALVTLALILLTLKVLVYMDIWISRRSKVFDVYLEFVSSKSVSLFVDEMRQQKCHLQSFEVGDTKIKGMGPTAIASVEVQNPAERALFLDSLRQMPFLHFVEEL